MEERLVGTLDAEKMIHLKRALGTIFLGQSLTAEQRSFYYRKLGLLMTKVSQIAQFAVDHPDLSRETGLDQDALTLQRAIGDVESFEWSTVARVLQEGSATQMHANKIDQLEALIAPVAQKLAAAGARLVPPERRFPVLPVLGVLAGGFLLGEVLGVTHVLGLRR